MVENVLKKKSQKNGPFTEKGQNRRSNWTRQKKAKQEMTGKEN